MLGTLFAAFLVSAPVRAQSGETMFGVRWGQSVHAVARVYPELRRNRRDDPAAPEQNYWAACLVDQRPSTCSFVFFRGGLVALMLAPRDREDAESEPSYLFRASSWGRAVAGFLSEKYGPPTTEKPMMEWRRGDTAISFSPDEPGESAALHVEPFLTYDQASSLSARKTARESYAAVRRARERQRF